MTFNRSLFLLLLFVAASCSSTKKSSQSSTSSSSKEAKIPPIVGTWQFSEFVLLNAPGNIPPKQLDGFMMRMKKSSSMEFKADKTLKTTVVDTTETGTWKSDAEFKTILLRKPSGTDTLRLTELSKEAAKGTLNTHKGASAKVELVKVH